MTQEKISITRVDCSRQYQSPPNWAIQLRILESKLVSCNESSVRQSLPYRGIPAYKTAKSHNCHSIIASQPHHPPPWTNEDPDIGKTTEKRSPPWHKSEVGYEEATVEQGL
jgi:hypothetical protein